MTVNLDVPCHMGDLVPSYLEENLSRPNTSPDLKAIIADYIEGRAHVLTKDAGDPSAILNTHDLWRPARGFSDFG